MSQLVQVVSNAANRLARRRAGELIIPIRRRIGGEPDQPPVWEASGIPDQVDPFDVEIAPLDVFEFAETVGVPPAQVFVGVLPTGLVVDIDTGIITGTPTVVGDFLGITATMDNGVGTDATVFAWEIEGPKEVLTMVVGTGSGGPGYSVGGGFGSMTPDQLNGEMNNRWTYNGATLTIVLDPTGLAQEFWTELHILGQDWDLTLLSADADSFDPNNNSRWIFNFAHDALVAAESYALTYTLTP